MENDLERVCPQCGTTNYGVLHHCLKCGAQLHPPAENAETLTDFSENRFEAPTIIEPAQEPDAYLEVISGEDRGNRYEIFDGIKFGRGKDCDIVVDSPKASREHALIIQNEYQQWLLSDLESTNGTLLNGKRVVKPTVLYNGDQIFIEGFEFSVAIKKSFLTAKPAREESVPSPDFSKKPQQAKKIRQRRTIIIAVIVALLAICICALGYFGWGWLIDNLNLLNPQL
jgi:hypothetical protein